MSVLADTGCQACCMGTDELRKLGLSEKDLLPVDMKLNGANGSQIKILGAVFVVISGRDENRKLWETNQLCYVAEKVGKMLLSKEALIKLGIISQSFPQVGSYNDSSPVVAEVGDTHPDTPNNEQFDLEPCAPEEDGSCTHSCTSTITLGGEGKEGSGKRCITGGDRTSSTEHSSHMVSQDGDSPKAQWRTQEDR